MKPLNLDNKPCSPISSNCVVWQGPDIPCIQLCTGDSVSDVVSAMATELCTILDTLKVSNYDLTCFNLQACGPEDFQALIQFLIEKICELEGVTPETKDIPGCPDCVVSVAECFVTGTQTTMQLVDYVQLIGERVCSIVTEISLINAQITDILIRVTNLENAPVPTFTLPTFTLDCTIGTLTGDQAIDTVLIEFINNVWCPFYAETGTTAELDAAGKQKCLGDADVQLNTGTAFSTNPNWILDANYDTLADAINNIWVALCDVWNYTNTNPPVTVADTNTIDLELNSSSLLTAKVQDTGWVNLLGFDWYSGAAASDGTRPQCRRIGNVIHFRGIVWIPMAKSPSDATVFPISSISSYYNNSFTDVATSGAGSCSLSGSDSLIWNQGNSVIPPEVIASQTIDGPARFQYPTVLSRPVAAQGQSVLLTAAGRFGIQASGELYFAALRDQELATTLGTSIPNNSPLRYITSRVETGQLIPNFDSSGSNVNSFPNHATWDVALSYNPGNIVLYNGAYYQCYTRSTPGLTPDVTTNEWSTYTIDIETDTYPNTNSYEFGINAGNADELGGFYATLEGLSAFIPCDSNPIFKAALDCDDPRP